MKIDHNCLIQIQPALASHRGREDSNHWPVRQQACHCNHAAPRSSELLQIPEAETRACWPLAATELSLHVDRLPFLLPPNKTSAPSRDTTIGLWSPAADQHLVSDANPQVSHSESQIPSLARKSETTTRAIMVETFLPPPHVTVYSTRTIDTSTSCTVRNLPNFAGLQVCPPLVRNPPFNLTFKGFHNTSAIPVTCKVRGGIEQIAKTIVKWHLRDHSYEQSAAQLCLPALFDTSCSKQPAIRSSISDRQTFPIITASSKTVL